MNAGLQSAPCAANRAPRTHWSLCEVGYVWIVPDSERTRADVCSQANVTKRRTGRVFRCTAVPGGTRVERVA